MLRNLTRLIFFGNYFVGLLAVSLCMETSFQLGLPLNDISAYLLVFLVPVFYYTYAYLSDTSTGNINVRTYWYLRHAAFLRIQQWISALVISVVAVVYCWKHRDGLALLHPVFYMISLLTLAGGLFYYGLISRRFFGFDMRHTGWLKAFVIGWVWAYFSTVLPVIFYIMEGGSQHTDSWLVVWFFVKNWMFCTANAIMFDIKDYPTDANEQLRTFVVRFGLRSTIYTVLIPMILAGVVSFSVFAWLMDFSPGRYLVNLLPFLMTLLIAFRLRKRHSILYYLVIIDGVLLLKAVCGIIASGL